MREEKKLKLFEDEDVGDLPLPKIGGVVLALGIILLLAILGVSICATILLLYFI